jgi:hypothetical protein
MPKFRFDIKQINEFEVEIEATDEAEAVKQFDEFIVDDFGDVVDCEIIWVVRPW